jgi:allophanate hydrolase subunit 2
VSCRASTAPYRAAAGDGFFSDTRKVAPEADRIGYRFKGGKPLEFVPRDPPFGADSDPSNITDACYPYGSIGCAQRHRADRAPS